MHSAHWRKTVATSAGEKFRRYRLSWSLIIYLLLCPVLTHASLESRGPSLYQLGLAVSPTADPGSPDARVFNPAAGSALPGWGLSAACSRSFNLPEFDRFQLAASGRFGSFNAGAWISGFGRTLYNERSIGLNASHPLPGSLHGGIGMTLSRISVRNYGSDGCLSGDLGLIWNSDGIHLGLSATNIIRGELSAFSGAQPPREVRLAAAYNATNTVGLHAELVSSERHDPQFRIGVETHLLPPLSVRFGYESGTDSLHLGLALGWAGWTGMSAFDHHPWLGWSQAFGLRWFPDSPVR